MKRMPRACKQYEQAVTDAAPRIWRTFDDYDRRWWAGRALGFGVPPRGGYKPFRLRSPFEVLAKIHEMPMGKPAYPASPQAVSTHATLLKSPL